MKSTPPKAESTFSLIFPLKSPTHLPSNSLRLVSTTVVFSKIPSA